MPTVFVVNPEDTIKRGNAGSISTILS